jgi:hypothetical protein
MSATGKSSVARELAARGIKVRTTVPLAEVVTTILRLVDA